MPKYSSDTIRKVSEANDIVDVISQYVPLKQRGRLYTACCPFHNEKTPSFTVDREKQLYHCFGCGVGGDLYTFIMEKENLQFHEAVKYLAERAGVDLPEESYNSEADSKKIQERKRLTEMQRVTANFYFKNLVESGEALGYLLDRGIDSATIRSFGIGFAPNSWNETGDMLKGLGYTEEEIISSGLAVTRSDKRGSYDRFRGRVMFPIQSVMGKVIGFGARKISEEDKGPKYLNTPETPVFSKGTQLYNLNRAKREIRGQPLLLVEGYMDVVALAKYGVKNTAAALGTAFTSDHAKLISRYTKDVILCFDGDAAGEKATFRSLETLADSDLNIRIIRLPVEHDPDSYVRENGREAFEQAIKNAIPITDFRLNVLKRDHDLTRSSGVIEYVQESCKILSGLNSVEQDYYARQIAQVSGVGIEAIKSQIKEFEQARTRKSVPPNDQPQRPQAPAKPKARRYMPRELADAQKIFLMFCYLDPIIIASSSITEDMMTKGFFRWLYLKLREINQVKPGASLLLRDESDRQYERLLTQLLLSFEELEGKATQELYNKSVMVIERYARQHRINQLRRELQADPKSCDNMVNELLDLKKVDWVKK